MQEIIKKIKNMALNLLFPCFCIGCGKEGLHLCSACAKNFKALKKGQKPLCAYSYESRLVKDLIYAFKYDGIKSLDQCIAKMLYEFLAKHKYSFAQEWIVSFVPMHRSKLEIRGFNQSELIALKLARLLGLEEQQTLEKTRRTVPQMQLKRSERLVNLAGAFKASAKVAGKKIILVDDVCTTGATLTECKKTLIKAGAKRVFCLAFAKD